MSLDFLTPEVINATIARLGANFDRFDIPYKFFNGTPIHVPTFVPKSLATQKKTVPLVVHFHGGGLIAGAAPDPAFLTDWVLDMIEQSNSVWVSPAYRLAPESPATAALEDIDDFWTWAHRHLPAAIKQRRPKLSVDRDNILTIGESAGGYLALESAFLFPHSKVKAVIAQYPSIFPDLPGFSPTPPVVDPVANETVNDFLASIQPGTIRLSTPFPQLVEELIEPLFATGRFRELWGPNLEGLTLRHALKVAPKKLPPIWVVQGTTDVMVPKTDTDIVVQKLREKRPSTKVLYTVQDGGHGFDYKTDITTPWVVEGLKFIKKGWKW